MSGRKKELSAAEFTVPIVVIIAFILGCAGPKKILTVQSDTQSQTVEAPDIDSAAQYNEEDTIPAESVKTDMGELIDSARNLCELQQYTAADSLLRKALDLIEVQGEQAENEWFPSEEYLNDIVAVYTELMPSTIGVPDDITMRVFQRQITISLDSMKVWPDDSAILSKLVCQKGITYDVPIAWNKRVQRALHFYMNTQRISFDKWFQRASYYLPLMKRMFADSGLPQDLAYLPLIESGFNPLAYSRARASGIWQFISSTGKRFGLRHNYWIDERRDVLKATGAAIRYLKELNNQFGHWYIALAAYNCGENGMSRTITRCNTNDYWQLALPSETMNYVPLYIAALTMAKNPTCFGYTGTAKDTFNLDTVYIHDCVDMKNIAEGINVPLDTLRRLNPHIIHWCTPPDMSNVSLYLPKGSAEQFHNFYSQLPDDQKVKWYRYKIRKGDNLASIARNFRVTVEGVKSVNKMKRGRLISGHYLLIPVAANEQVPAQLADAQAADIPVDDIGRGAGTPVPSNALKIKYRVKSGDSVGRIASMFNVGIDDICRWNNLRSSRFIKTGRVLAIYKVRGGHQSRKQRIVTPVSVSGNSTYKVKRGDTPYSIARSFGMSVDQLIAINNLDPSRPVIRVGDVLMCSGSTPADNGAVSPTITDSTAQLSGKNSAQAPDSTQVKASMASGDSSARTPTVRTVSPLKRQVSTENTFKYKVSPGDNLFRICQNFGVKISTVRRLNNLADNAVLHVGDIILLPGDTGKDRAPYGSGEQVLYYEVKSGDNLWRIAELFKIPVEQLYKLNNLSSDSVLMPGEILKVVPPKQL